MNPGLVFTNLIFVFSQRRVQLRFKRRHRARHEKNWILLNSNETHLDLVASLDPFRIVSCKIETGCCEVVQGSVRVTATGELRGGTNLVRLPTEFGNFRDVYVGFARAHLRFCLSSQVRRFYRPNLVVLIRDRDGTMKLVAVSRFFDFHAIVPRWPPSRMRHECVDRVSVLLPCSIARWNLENDTMFVTLSASDVTVSVIQVCGVMRVVAEVVNVMRELDVPNSGNVVQRAMLSSREFCERYAMMKWSHCPGFLIDNQFFA